ncbi:hypothetical protein O6P43_005298, partial [Quillaja saponaria]
VVKFIQRVFHKTFHTLIWAKAEQDYHRNLFVLTHIRTQIQGKTYIQIHSLRNHHEDAKQGEEWIPSECCNQPVSFHPPTAFLQKSTSADLVGSPPCPESWPSHCQWYRNFQPPK